MSLARIMPSATGDGSTVFDGISSFRGAYASRLFGQANIPSANQPIYIKRQMHTENFVRTDNTYITTVCEIIIAFKSTGY